MNVLYIPTYLQNFYYHLHEKMILSTNKMNKMLFKFYIEWERLWTKNFVLSNAAQTPCIM